MREFESYKTVTTLSDVEKLPTGGYIIGILAAEEINYDWGDVLEIKFDIADGEYKNYFTNQYKNSQFEDKKYKGIYRLNIPKDDGSELDEFMARKFKTDIAAIEDSNQGFHWTWDEKQLLGKKVGAIFFEKEYDYAGKHGFFTTTHSLRPVETIQSGKFKVPAPKMLTGNKRIEADIAFDKKNDYGSFSDISKEDLPF